LLVIPSKAKRPWKTKEAWPRHALIVMELKKVDQAFSAKFRHQPIAQFLALDFKVESAVVTLLTDRWFFYWLSIDRQVCSLEIHDLVSGVTTLRDILRSSSGAAQFQLQLSSGTSPIGRSQVFTMDKHTETNGKHRRARVVPTASVSVGSSDSSDPNSRELSSDDAPSSSSMDIKYARAGVPRYDVLFLR
jgi:hypothetical protein